MEILSSPIKLKVTNCIDKLIYKRKHKNYYYYTSHTTNLTMLLYVIFASAKWGA